MKKTESRRNELLRAAFLQKDLTEMTNLFKQGAKPTLITPQDTAKMMKHEDFIINILSVEEIRNQDVTTIMEMFVEKDAAKIKSFLSFVDKHFYEATMDKQTFEWTRNVRPGFEKFVSRDEELFYLQKLKSLDKKSIIQYVVDGGDEMMVLREQLLDTMVKIDRKIYHEDSEKDDSKDRVIANIKRDIPSSRNLSNCIESLETRYSWGLFTRIGDITKSFLANILLGWVTYGLDIWSDLDYSVEVYGTKCNTTNQDAGNGTMDCLEDSVYLQQGIIGFAHVFIPQTVALLIGLISLCLGLLTWVSLPLPLITKGYRFCLDIRHASFKGKEKPPEDKQDEKLMKTQEEREEYERRKESYKIEKASDKDVQEKMKLNDRDILMAQQVECTGESSFQFFMKTLWLMPTLLMEQKETTNFEDLFNIRVLSVVISFVTMGKSYTSIRLKISKQARKGYKYFFSGTARRSGRCRRSTLF